MDFEKREWKVGDTYRIVDEGRYITGTIEKIDEKGYHVKWSDGSETIEDSISPASKNALRNYPSFR